MLTILLLTDTALAGGQLAIIIDDIGYNGPLGRRASDLQGPFTLAILPFTPHTRELAERGYRQKKEIILHAPMSNTSDIPLGEGGLRSGMQRENFVATLRANLANVPHLRGVNNHMGSQLTQESEPMNWLMSELAEQQLYFIDSRTTAKSQALQIARSHRIPSMKRDIFLDNVRDVTKIKQQLIKAIDLAKHQGSAIAIGHPYPETLAVLETALSLLNTHRIELVTVSHLLAANEQFFGGKKSLCRAPPVSLWIKPPFIELPDMTLLLEDLGIFGYQ